MKSYRFYNKDIIPNEIMEIFKVLIYAKDNLQTLIDGSTQKRVKINAILSQKNKKKLKQYMFSMYYCNEYYISFGYPLIS